MSTTKSQASTEPSLYVLERRLEQMTGLKVPEKLMEAMLVLVRKGVADISLKALTRSPTEWYIEIRAINGYFLPEDAAVLSDLNLRNRNAGVDRYTWDVLHPLGRDRAYSVFGAEALARFAELSSMPLVDFMAIMGALDAGADVLLTADFGGVISVGSVDGPLYAWALTVYTHSKEAREFMGTIASPEDNTGMGYWHPDEYGRWRTRISSYGGPYGYQQEPFRPAGLEDLPEFEP